jgi:hypothetical protein
MNSRKNIICFTILLSFCLLTVNIVAKEKTRELDTKSIASMIMSKTISDENLEALDLSYEEFVEIASEVATYSGKTKKEMFDFFKKNGKVFRNNFNNFKMKKKNPKNTSKNNETPEGILRGSCTQTVEFESGTTGRTYAFSYTIDAMCDNDSSDDDWRFDFGPTWTDDPDDIRWDATYWVEFTFSVVYGGNLLGCSLCTCPLQICLGTGGVTSAGGEDNVKEELWIWHK